MLKQITGVIHERPYLSLIQSVIVTYIVPLIIFLGITFIINPTIFTGFSTLIEKNDGRLLAWTVSWDIHKLLTDPLGIYDANIYYPNQNTLTYSEHFIAGSILAIPVWLLTDGNPAASFNFLMILGYTLNAFCTYILVKYLTKRRLAGLIAGIIFGYCSYRIANFGHLQNMLVFYIPLLTYFLFRYFENKRYRFLIGAGLSLLMMSLTSWYHMIFIWGMFVLFLAYFVFKKQFVKSDLIKFGVLIAINLAIILPFALPYFAFNKDNQSAYTMNELKTYSADIGGYLMPPPNTFIGGVVLPWLRVTKERWQENINFIGYIALTLSLVAVFTIRRTKDGFKVIIDKTKLIFAGIGLFFVLLSFGPFLHLSDKVTRIPLVYWFIFNFLPPIRFIRVTGRFATIVFLFVGILSGFGFARILNKFKNRNVAVLFTAVISVFILAEYYPHHNFFSYADVSKTPAVYTQVKNDPSVKAILELPIDVGPFETTKYVYYAGIHFKPIVNGYSGFEPKDYNFNKHLFEYRINDIGLVKLQEIGVTHIIVNPTYTQEITNPDIELISSEDGYKLYKIKDTVSNYKGYFTDFSDNNVSYNTKEPTFGFNGTQLNSPSSDTPVYNVAPTLLNSEESFTIRAEEDFKYLTINFRAYSKDDKVTINCIDDEDIVSSQEFSNQNDYLTEVLFVECNTNSAEIKLLSTEFTNRSMVTAAGFIDL